MNDGDVSKQIQQMVRFIRQEAEEKANEINVSAEEEFNIEKLQLVEAEKKKVKQEYERKLKQVETKRRIEYSMQLNESRIKYLQTIDDVVNEMRETASKELLRVSDDNNNSYTYKKLLQAFSDDKNSYNYKKILQGLIVQGLSRVKESSVLVRCREMDRKVVESILEDAKGEYTEKAKVRTPTITIDKVYLPPPPGAAEIHGPTCSGGVVVASQDGRIICDNTLDERLRVAFRQKLPQIRKHMFGDKPC